MTSDDVLMGLFWQDFGNSVLILLVFFFTSDRQNVHMLFEFTPFSEYMLISHPLNPSTSKKNNNEDFIYLIIQGLPLGFDTK